METKDVEAIYPLAPMQQGMLFHTLYSPETEIYSQQLKYTLSGELNVAAFKQAWQNVVARHAALRAAFIEQHEQPLQIVLKSVTLPWEEHDWRELSETEQQLRLESLLQSDRRRAFDLNKPPLLRLTLIRLSDRQYQFIWSYHHMILDGWSVWLIVKDVFTFYHALSEGREVTLKPAPSYKNYVAWVKQQDSSIAEMFWRDLLGDFSKPTPLAIGHTQPNGSNQASHVYREVHGELSPESTTALQFFARQQQLTVNTIVQGAWSLLLSRYTGLQDIVYGTVVAGRPAELPAVEEMIGLFINTLPVRVQVDPQQSLLPWLKELQRQQIATRQYEFSPLVQLQRWSGVPIGEPLFESLLAFENYPTQQALAQVDGGLRISEINSVEGNNYPLTVIVAPGKSILLRVMYDAERFTDEAVQRMLSHFQCLLQSMAANPEQLLWKLPLTNESEPATDLLIFDKELVDQKNYWVERLSGCVPQVTLPVDYQRKQRTSEQAVVQTRLNAALYERLRALTADSAFLTYTALLSALEVCMLQYTGNREVLVGSPAQQELGRANALVVRNQLDERATFKGLLEQVRQTLLAGYGCEEYPYERLAQELGWSRAPFDVLVGLAGFHGELPEVGQSLTLRFEQAGEELLATLEYGAESYQEESVRALWRQFERVLRTGLAGGEKQLAELGRLSEAEQWRVVQEWNESTVSYPGASCIHELFEQQVARDGEAVAIVYEGQTLSYVELNQRANRLAHYLLKYGLKPGMRVGIYLEHSATEVAALLAVLKAGGTYVPLEPAHPSTRLAYIIEDAQLELVLTQQHLANRLATTTAPLVLLDDESEVWEESEESNPLQQAQPGDLAYVIYTSGSTGQPKGVEISHGALVNYIWWAKEVYLQGEPLASALYSSLAFDLTVTSLYVPLVSGNRLLIYGWEGKEPPLLRIVEEGQVGVLKLTPSHLALLRGRELRQGGVRRLIVGGEALTTELAHEVWESFGGAVEILNEYGPTETTVGCMLHRYEVEQDQRAAVPIGRAAGNMQLYLLDERQQPVAENVLGELYIAGAGLAQGYLGQPGLTAARFVPNPFVAGERMYKSGDLARRLANGKLEYVGRRDEQVKFHGYRVEWAEIEWALQQHPQVRESVVRVERDGQGQEVMLGYYVARQELEAGELRQFLKRYLIEETIPNVFVHLRGLPLTLNGKVDHRALPTLAESRQKMQREYREPQTETEQALARIWATSLGVERVGAEDNFFELGGHSLSAMQLLSRIRDAFQVDLPLRTVFDAPTVAGLARKIEQTSKENSLRLPPIDPAGRTQPLPLSFAQERLWFLDRMVPEDPFYNVVFTVRLSGKLDVAALERSLSEIIRRHEVLRTSFVEVDERPIQLIGPPSGLSLSVEDLRHLAAAERESTSRTRIVEEAQRPFILSEGPLLRVNLLCTKEEEHIAVLTMHHIVSDGWSMGVFIRELGTLYEAYTQGNNSPLEELPIQYADYAVWQREQLRGERLEQELSYWREQLRGAPAVLELPTDRPRPAVQSHRGRRRQFTLSEELSGQIREIARSEGVTQFMLLAAAFNVLLHRYSGQEDILIGAPVAGRERAELEELIGFFVNTLVIRTDLSGDPTFKQLLDRVRTTVISAQEHQSLPFEKIVEELQPERSLSHSPLFQVVFALQNAPQGVLDLTDLKLSAVENQESVAKFDLTLEMIEGSDGRLYGGLDYNADLYEPATISRMVAHFHTLLDSAVADPDRRLSALPMLTKTESKKLLEEWTEFKTEYPRDASIGRLFERQVAQTPDAIAIAFEQEKLTYRQLNERANQLAHYLARLNVGPEVLVGVCLERSLDMVVSLLAVLKAGGAFIPLDPSYPRDRLDFMLSDTKTPVLVTQERFAIALQEHSGVRVCLDAETELIAKESKENPVVQITGDHLAYVMYTSGSTGAPKASCIPHRAVVRLVKATNYAEFGPEHAFLQFAPFSFDASTLEIWGTLLNGGRLVVFPAYTPTLEELGRVIQQSAVTSLWLTSGLFNQMVEEQLASLKGVRQLLAGGDVLSVPHIKKALNELDQCSLINGYGPTENTTFTCCYRIDDPSRLNSSVPIGRPIANTRVLILDQRQQLVPAGVAGELCVGGDGLSRGYFNDVRLTAEKFIPNPFSKEPGDRLYRTGDLVRYLSDGTIEFIGRVDNQVKVRGFRVELGEIEATVNRHSSVQESVVVLSEGNGSAKKILAYVVTKPGEPLSVSELRSYCQRKLPNYMTPSEFIMMESLPLMPNGKVNRRALAALERDDVELEGTLAEPRTPIEEAIAGIWAEVLNLKKVGIHDNFFDLGGHSLATTQVASRLSKVFQVHLPLRSLFEAPTVAELSRRVEDELLLGQSQYDAAPISLAPRDEPASLSFAQQRLWFLDQFEPNSPLYNISSVVRLTGQLNVAALEESLSEIVRRHEVLRSRFTIVDGEARQIVSPAAALKLEVRDLGELTSEEREPAAIRVAIEEGQVPFDLSQPPLLRVMLLRLADEEHIAVLTMHHIVSDGWSMGVFIRELGALYEAYTQGNNSPLLELPIQYADYAVWQREQLQGERLEQELSYWREQLRGAPAVLELPTDRPRPAVQRHRGGRRQFTMNEELSGQIRELARSEGVTQFMLLAAAFNVLLHRYSGQEDILVGTGVANRTRVETEALIGFFLNSLVLRTDLSGDPSFRELLIRVREMTLGAYAHQALPFEKLVEAMRPERSLSRNPLFQVWFILQNAPMPSLNLSGLKLTPVELEPESSRFDLGMGLVDTPGGLGGWLEYNKDLFDESTIDSLVGHYESVLSMAVKQTEMRLSEFRAMLDTKEHQKKIAKRKEYRKTVGEKLQHIRRRVNLTSIPNEHSEHREERA